MSRQLSSRRRWLAAALSVAAFSVAGPAHAAWPEKPIRIVVPSSPGGGADAVARLVGDRLSRAIGQPVIIDNKGGGGGNIATDFVAKAPPDGYTVLFTGNNHTVNVSLFAKSPYALEDFASVIELTRGPSVFVAATNAPFTSLREMIAAAQARPDTIAYGSPGIGLPSHIAFELFQRDAGVRLVHAPYKGSGPSLADAAGGQIPVVAATLSAGMPHIKSGRLRALAVTSPERWPGLPDVPTVAEVIGKPYQHLTWFGMFAPKGTADVVIARLNGEIGKILADPEVKATIEAQGTNTVGGSAASFQKMIEAEYLTSKALIQSAKLRAD